MIKSQMMMMWAANTIQEDMLIIHRQDGGIRITT